MERVIEALADDPYGHVDPDLNEILRYDLRGSEVDAGSYIELGYGADDDTTLVTWAPSYVPEGDPVTVASELRATALAR